MVVRNVLDLMSVNLRKNIMSVILVSAGIFLTVFLSLLFCSEKSTYNDIDKALGGNFERFGVIEVETNWESQMRLQEAFQQISGIYAASEFHSDNLISALDDGIRNSLYKSHSNISEYSDVLYADPCFLQNTGIELEDGIDWEYVVERFENEGRSLDGLISGENQEDSAGEYEAVYFVLLGANYKDVDWQPEYRWDEETVDGTVYHYRWIVLGCFEPNQNTINPLKIQSENVTEMTRTVLLDDEIVVLSKEAASWYFITTTPDLMMDTVSGAAKDTEIEFGDLSVLMYRAFFNKLYYETNVIMDITKRGLVVLIPAFVLLVIILGAEIFYTERRHLALMIINGFYSKTLRWIMAFKFAFGMSLSVVISAGALNIFLPRYFSTERDLLMQMARQERVFLFAGIFILLVLLIQIMVSFIGLKKQDVIESIRFTE